MLLHKPGVVLNPWPNRLAGRRKFAKPELAYGRAMGGQTDSQVGSQIHASPKIRKLHAGTCVDLRMNFGSTQVVACSRKSTQVGGQTKCKLNASRILASICESVWPELYIIMVFRVPLSAWWIEERNDLLQPKTIVIKLIRCIKKARASITGK